jgi:hypothetical protein
MLAMIQSRTFCLLVYYLKTRKYEHKNYNFVCGFVWVWNLVSDIKGGTQTEGVSEQDAKENIWTEEEWNDMRLEKFALWGAS